MLKMFSHKILVSTHNWEEKKINCGHTKQAYVHQYVKSNIYDVNNIDTCRDKARTGSVSTGGFSEYDEGGEFGGPGVKINEWQAAWNVTNAIQVRKIYRRALHKMF